MVQTSSSPRARILVVDDDPQLLDLLVDTLTTIGYHATPAPGGPEALDCLNEASFDLVITDVKMPDIDGLQLLRKIRRHHHDLPVLVITGVASPELVGQASPDGFLSKPFRITQIEEMIEQTLARGDSHVGLSQQPRLLLVGFGDVLNPHLQAACQQADIAHFHAPSKQRAEPELETGRFQAVVFDAESLNGDLETLCEMARRYQPDATVWLYPGTRANDPISLSQSCFDGLIKQPVDAQELRRLVGTPVIAMATEPRRPDSASGRPDAPPTA